MTDAIFSKSFGFNIFKFKKYHLTDNTKTPINMHYFGCLIKGSAELISKKERIKVTQNEIFYIPKGLKYQSHWFSGQDGQIEFYSFGFEFSPINKPFILQKIECCNTARKLFDDLCKEIPITANGYGKLYLFLGAVSSNMKQDKIAAINPTVERATEYMAQNINCKISDVAMHCGVSESGLYSTFKRVLNKTPNEIRLKLLCQKAEQLLITTNLSVEQISVELKISSSSYFRKIFKSYWGKTPRQVYKESRNI